MNSLNDGKIAFCDIPNGNQPPSSLSANLDDKLLLQPDGHILSDANKDFDEILEELKLEESRDYSTEVHDRKKKEVYKFETDWLISNVCWSNDDQCKLALTSLIEEYANFVQVVHLARDECDQEIESLLTFEHPYPATKIQWCPRQSSGTPQLLATTADYLRLWRLESNSNDGGELAKANLECLLNSNKGSKLCAPLTSFDWSPDASTIVTSSVDTTCAIWDVITNAMKVSVDTASVSTASAILRTQLVAHENHVYDVSWSTYGSGKDVIVTSSADGSVRLFDLRDLSTSTIVYESNKNKGQRSQRTSSRSPLARVSCSKTDGHLVATFAIDSSELIILDTRNPGRPLCVLNKHMDRINSISWSHQSGRSICSGADDLQTLIWQLPESPQPQKTEPLLAYRADGKINSTSWAPNNIWVAIGYRNSLELLRV